MKKRTLPALFTVLLLQVSVEVLAVPLSFAPGNYFATQFFETTISEYSRSGDLLTTVQLSGLQNGEETKGLAYGPDGRMYIVIDDIYSSARLVAIDPGGKVVSSYALPNSTGGNLSYGKIIFTDDNHALVGTQMGLIKIDIRDPESAQMIFSGSVFDVVQQPNGNLIVIDGNRVWELDADGSRLREVVLTDSTNISQSSFFNYNDLRGLEFDPVKNYLYMSMLGNSGNLFFKTMIFDLLTQDLRAIETFRYGDDMFLLDGDTLLLGSRTDSPWILDPQSLSSLGRFEGGAKMFVTGVRTSAIVPTPATLSLMAIAVFALTRSRFLAVGRRRKEFADSC